MTFNDIFKSSFLENMTSISIFDMVIALILAFGIGLFIFMVYKKTYQGVMYSSSFGTTLIALTMITTVVILAVTSNVVLSLGMVGALSIVRFRNAVKDPADLTYLFWSISIGIVTGAGLFELALILLLIVALLISVLDLIPSFRAPCLLVVTAKGAECEKEILAQIKKFTKSHKIRSRNISKNGTEWIIELQVKKEAELVSEVAKVEGVDSVHLMTHDGDVRF